MPKREYVEPYKRMNETKEVQYRERLVKTPLKDIQYALKYLSQNEARRQRVLFGVNHMLAINYKKIQAGGKIPTETTIAFEQDVAIWFANEILAGRARMDNRFDA